MCTEQTVAFLHVLRFSYQMRLEGNPEAGLGHSLWAVPKPMCVSKFAVVIRRSTKYAYCLFVLQIVLRTRPALRQTPVYRTLADFCGVSAASCVARLTASTRAPSSALVEFIGFAKR